MSWDLLNNSVWIYKYDNIINKNNLLCFDLDETLITTKSGNKFAKSVNDWKFKKNVLTKLQNESKDNNIIIFSNQLKFKEDIKIKIKNIIKELNLNVYVFISIQNNTYRKPFIGMFQLMLKLLYNNDINLINNISYIGDAAGRLNDFSCSDRKFAYNIGYFYDKTINFYTPEEYFENLSKEDFNWDDINFKEYKNNTYTDIKLYNQQEIILFVGYPGSGKTTLYNKLFKNKGYVHINQDTLKTVSKCISLTKKEIKNGKSIIIDNTNSSQDIRHKYIQLALENNINIRCIYFDITEKLAKHLNKYRMITDENKYVPDITYNVYNKKFIKPDKSEGFNEIIFYKFHIDENIINKKYFYMKF